jgi:hypothetical protein
MSVTQWDRGAFEKLIDSQLVKKFLPIYAISKFIAVVTGEPITGFCPEPVIYNPVSRGLPWRSVLAFSSHLGLSLGLLPSELNSICIVSLPYVNVCDYCNSVETSFSLCVKFVVLISALFLHTCS